MFFVLHTCDYVVAECVFVCVRFGQVSPQEAGESIRMLLV